MQDQVGMILRIKWVCFEKQSPAVPINCMQKLGFLHAKNLTAIEYLTYTIMPKNQQIKKAREV